MPLWGRVSAGPGVSAIPEYDTTDAPAGADFALVVDGDSMEPDFNDGEIIYIREQPVIDSGQIAVIQVHLETDYDPTVYLKKVKDAGEHYILLSLNPEYEPLTFRKEDCRILGVAINKRAY